ncbi:organic hydroperoxide resistance protein [Massilia sp. RP-1-19]|uniref:Organic hydroperoxide resistance protein n=1 Tax=Massilia polaris TaxID=2728846 RepID=A0A848HM16_9BURK|nr:organic hydroperoxide resistance protein [Massilia polaris]NML62946.1 organic hydroperoxide resistance protein [Massilia polaris]
MKSIEKVLYTAVVETSAGGRDGVARSTDGRLDIALSSPGTSGTGTNPEQLLAAGWSACFLSAIRLASQAMKVELPADIGMTTNIDLGTNDDGYQLQAQLQVRLPGVPREVAQQMVDIAHASCPYSKLSRGNIDVTITIV